MRFRPEKQGGLFGAARRHTPVVRRHGCVQHHVRSLERLQDLLRLSWRRHLVFRKKRKGRKFLKLGVLCTALSTRTSFCSVASVAVRLDVQSISGRRSLVRVASLPPLLLRIMAAALEARRHGNRPWLQEAGRKRRLQDGGQHAREAC